MRQTIRVDRVLREAVHTPYADLVTRPTGRAVRTSIRQSIAAEGAPLALLDFSEIGLVDFSCADEIIAKLLLDPPADTFLVLQGLREEQLEAIEHVLDYHALAAVVHDRESGAARVVGRVDPDLRIIYWTLETVGSLDLDGLTRETGWSRERTSIAVESLVRLRLIRDTAGHYTLPLSA